MTKGTRFAEEFKRDAVAQAVGRGYSVREVADRYRRRPGQYGGKPAVVMGNTLARQFEVVMLLALKTDCRI